MPKQIDYPRATLKNSLELARAVDGLGGKSSVEMTADALNKKMGGAFQALVGAATKYGLVVNKQGQLETTDLFRNHKLAYSEREASSRLAEAFLSVPLFRKICVRFENKPLPVNHFEKLLVREFEVPDKMGSRVAKYFLEGAKQCNLLGPDHVLRTSDIVEGTDQDSSDSELDYEQPDIAKTDSAETLASTPNTGSLAITNPNPTGPSEYSVRIKGLGMDSVIAIHDEEDLLIVKAMLKKVEKKLLESPDNDDQ